MRWVAWVIITVTLWTIYKVWGNKNEDASITEIQMPHMQEAGY